MALSSTAMGNQHLIRACLVLLLLMAPLPAQFGEINTVFDDRLLKDNDRQLLADLPNEIGRFFDNMAWDGDFGDLAIPLHLQLIFEGTSSKGAEKTYLVQALISNGLDQRYFDKSVQFSLISSGINYSPGFFDPLSSFLTYYGYLILAGEADTYVPNGGSQFYEICREIAMRGSSSDYSKGWSERVRQVDELSTNYGLRKARLAYYYGEELFRKGELDKALVQLKDVVNGLDMVYQKTGREQNVNTFMKAHCGDLARMLGMLGQKELLLDLVELDPDNEKIYQAALESL